MKRIRKVLSEVRDALVARLRRRPSVRKKPGAPLYRVERVDLFPDSLSKGKIYLAGEDGQFWGAALLCPCGCGDTIELNLLKQVRPAWRVDLHRGGYVSIYPSVWRQKGCRSHFVMRKGRINWF